MGLILRKGILGLLIFSLLCAFGYAQTPVFEKSDASVVWDTNAEGVLDVGDTVEFELSITNTTDQPILVNFTDKLTTGLAGLDIVSYPKAIVANPAAISTSTFNLDTYNTTGPVQPLPNLTAQSISTNSGFNKTGNYAGLLSGLVGANRYYGFCVELNQSISLGNNTMSIWRSPISAPIQTGVPTVAGGPVISTEQKLMIQGILCCLGAGSAQAFTSTSKQDLVLVIGAEGAALKNLTATQAAAAQIALWEIVHEPWTGPSSVSLTSGLITWKIQVSGSYTLPAAFVEAFNNLVSCAAAYTEMMRGETSIVDSTSEELWAKNINIQPGASASIVFTAIISEDAVDGEEIINTACAEIVGSACTLGSNYILCDTGKTPPVTNKEEPPPQDDFCATTYLISTEAGTGRIGIVGDGGPAVSARLNYPYQACVDQANNLYIADYSNHAVRMINSLGIMTTIAGTLTSRGYSGDGGLAVNAKLSFPTDVYVRGNYLYISELGNSVIRKVDLTTNIITTVVGIGTEGYSGDTGPATSAQLYRPRAVYVDVAGNIYIADTFNFCIRKVDAETGVITTIAGTGTPGHATDGDVATETQLEWIHDIVMNSEGILFFSEQNGYNLVRKIVKGKIVTVAGKEGISEIGDCGLAVDSYLNKPYGLAFDTLDNLYIADEKNNKVRKVDALTGFITTIAGTGVAGYNGDGINGTDALLNAPTGVVVDSNNFLHIVDRFNQRVRKMDLMNPTSTNYFPSVDSGEIDTIAGNGTAGFNGDGAIAKDCQLSYPGGLAAYSSGAVIFADRTNHRIRKINTDGSIITIAGTGSPRGYAGDGGDAVSAKLNFPNDVAIDASSNIYVADQSNHVIRKINAFGKISTIAGTGVAGFSGDGGAATLAQLNNPESVEIYAGKLYISDKDNHRLRVIDLTTNIITTIAGTGLTGKGAENVDPLTTPLDTPRGITIDNTGQIYIAMSTTHVIRKINTAGLISTYAGTGYAGYTGDGGQAKIAKLSSPVDVAIDSDGSLFIAEYRNHIIRKVDALGVITTVAGNGTIGYSGDGGPAIGAKLNYPTGIAINYDGDILIADRMNSAIRIIGR